MGTYCPWRDIGARLPDVVVSLQDIAPARAAWVAGPRVVFLDKRLSTVEGRCALAHELAHIDLDHKPRGIAYFDRRQEREADRLAARRLIPIDRLADVLMWTRDEGAVAEALHVDVDTVNCRLSSLHPAERHHIEARLAQLEYAA